jgi:hypothetical protein
MSRFPTKSFCKPWLSSGSGIPRAANSPAWTSTHFGCRPGSSGREIPIDACIAAHGAARSERSGVQWYLGAALNRAATPVCQILKSKSRALDISGARLFFKCLTLVLLSLALQGHDSPKPGKRRWHLRFSHPDEQALSYLLFS